MIQQINRVSLHITNECSHKCPMCYITKDGQIKCEGNIDVLKAIAIELKKSNVNDIQLVGGDPCEHSKILDLLTNLHSLGFNVMIESNTHNYKNATLEQVVPLIDTFDTTIHGQNSEIHDGFADFQGAYISLLDRLKRIQELKSQEQEICITYNVMEHNYNKLYESTVNILNYGIDLSGISIQRIGPYGKAYGTDKFGITTEQIITAMDNIHRINTELGIPIGLVDAFPYCLVPKEYHQYLSKCDWGYEIASIDMKGNISRCAVSNEIPLGNILKDDLTYIWNYHPQLLKFRSKDYLDTGCKECNNLELCGGGCAMSCGNNILESDSLIKKLK